jgi:hypothetical protein
MNPALLFVSNGAPPGFERARGADRSGRKSATHGSAAARSPAATAEAMAGRRLRRANPAFGTMSITKGNPDYRRVPFLILVSQVSSKWLW